MNSFHPGVTEATKRAGAEPRVLSSWKDIAEYLGRGVRTVQRWEQNLGLPVRRPLGASRKSTVAMRSDEVDVWLATRFSARPSEEVQQCNELLTQSNNDLTNLLYSVRLPVVIVGGDFSLRRFTPQAATVLGLTTSDIGRPMLRLRLKIDLGKLEQNMRDVMKQEKSQDLQVGDIDGGVRSLRLVPYRTMDNRVDGIVLILGKVAEMPHSSKKSDAQRTLGKGDAKGKKSTRSKPPK